MQLCTLWITCPHPVHNLWITFFPTPTRPQPDPTPTHPALSPYEVTKFSQETLKFTTLRHYSQKHKNTGISSLSDPYDSL